MICYNCFQEKGSNPVCPHCHFNDSENKSRFPTALPAGITIGKQFLLGRVLGQGGFGITYIALDTSSKMRVAIKEYFPDSMATRDATHSVTPFTGERGEGFAYGKKCFLEEAKTLATFIGNPNIVRVYRYFEEYGTAYFVMEFIEGTSLKDYLKSSGGKISFAEAKKILIPMMDALSVVHSKGIVHRDISPDNIIITKDGKVKLLDFGAARYSLGDMSRSLDVVLKHGYAPREQYSRHGRQGPFTDVYSLSATFYRAITGIVPQDSIDRLDEDLLITPKYYCPDLTPQGEYALFKGLTVQPADRFQSTQQLKECILSNAPVPPAQFKPAPVGKQPQASANRSGTSVQTTSRSVSASSSQSFAPSISQSYTPKSQSYSPARSQSVTTPRSQPYAPPKAQSYTPPAAQQTYTPTPQTPQPYTPPAPMPVTPPAPVKQQKKFNPIKPMLISFSISMTVLGIVLLIILLLR